MEDDVRSLRKELGLSDLVSLSSHHASKELPFTVGEQLSLADLCLVPQMANAKRYSLICLSLHSKHKHALSGTKYLSLIIFASSN